MSLSRWKMMAGVLGVSLGGLAAIAGQCPKTDANKTVRRAAEPQAPAEGPVIPVVPPGGTGPATKAPMSLPALPAPPVDVPPPPAPATGPLGDLPALPTTPARAEVLPALPTTPAKPDSLPALPPPSDTSKKPVPMPSTPPATVLPASGTTLPPALPSPVAETPKPSTTPPAPPALPTVKPDNDPFAKPPANTVPDAPSLPGNPEVTLPGKPMTSPPSTGGLTPPVVNGNQTLPPPVVGNSGAILPPSGGTDVPVIETPKPEVRLTPPAVPQATAQTKFRIVLRVGEGEPTFEVKCGDDLVMKVVCEKVDIKSPEKGQGLSAVKASGKVRFVGFGAEGTCDELSFLAGTGEVGMVGNVKVQVKDKLGRVESEITTETMKYKIDAAAIVGTIR